LLQGFQILADTDTAWGGVAVELLEYLRDDYRATPIVALATAEHGGFAKQSCADFESEAEGGARDVDDSAVAERRRPLNAALSMVGLAEHASLVVPIHSTGFGTAAQAHQTVRFPTIRDYNTSAITAAAVETTTLPYRLLSQQRGRMSDITSVLTSSGDRRPIPLCSLEVQIPLDWRKLVLDVEGEASHSPEPTFDADLASRYLARLSESVNGSHARTQHHDDGRCPRPSMSSLTPQYGELRQLLPAGAAWESWNDDELCDVYTVRGLDLRLRRGVAAPAALGPGERQHSFRARSRCSTFIGGTLPLPLCFPPVLQPPDDEHAAASQLPRGAAAGGAAADRSSRSEPEPEPERSGGTAVSQQHLHEASVATRLTTAPAGLFSVVHASQEVVRATKSGQNPGMMAAVGGIATGMEGVEQLGEAEETLASMRDCLYASLHIDAGDGEEGDDY
jgi:hypothetical protein